MPSSAEPALIDHWAASGAMWLTGHADGPPLRVAGAPADAVAAHLRRLFPDGGPDERLLGERAAITGRGRRGRTSVGGAARLLPARDGWVTLSLPRADDLQLVPALTGASYGDPWGNVARWLEHTDAEDAVDRARLLDLASSVVPDTPRAPRRPAVLRSDGGVHTTTSRPLVIDLSALWAGPLCAHLLGLLGADVVKVESSRRPDGARGGASAFFDLLHAGHRSVALDLTSDDGRARLRTLVERADVVIEASRPRALRRLGLDADSAVARGVIWVSITAYGRQSGDEHLIGFGDDVAAGAGLVARDEDGPLFAGDAMADPLAGVQAAAAAVEALADAQGCLLDVSMHDTARAAATTPATSATAEAKPPTARTPTGRAATLGADNDNVLAVVGRPNTEVGE